MVEEARQETVRIIKSSSRPRDNLTKAKREALRTLKKNTDLAILPADKGNATVILYTVDYKQKITSLFEDPFYKWLTRYATEWTESKKHNTALKNPHSQNIYANNCVQLAPDPSDYIDFLRYIKKGSL